MHLPHSYWLVYIERRCICHTWTNQAITCGQIASTEHHKAIIFMFLLGCKFTWANPFSHHTTMVLTSSKILWATHFIVAIGDAYIHECKLYWLYKIFELLDLRKTWSCKTNLQYLLYSPFPTIVRFCPKLDVGSGHPIKQKDPLKWWGSWEHYKKIILFNYMCFWDKVKTLCFVLRSPKGVDGVHHQHTNTTYPKP